MTLTSEEQLLVLEARIFAHVPHLADQILHPEKSRFRNRDMKEFDERAKAPDFPKNWRRPPEEREALRAAFIAPRLGEDMWVFAYGSLMWDPSIYFEEVRIGKALGYKRSFCLRAEVGRGSIENPGLMAGLSPGEMCEGLVFRIDKSIVERETQILWQREMAGYGYNAEFLPVDTSAGRVEAMTFVAAANGPRYEPNLDVEEAARRIASAFGTGGTNIEYLDNLARQLELLGLRDDAFAALHARAKAHLPLAK